MASPISTKRDSFYRVLVLALSQLSFLTPWVASQMTHSFLLRGARRTFVESGLVLLLWFGFALLGFSPFFMLVALWNSVWTVLLAGLIWARSTNQSSWFSLAWMSLPAFGWIALSLLVPVFFSWDGVWADLQQKIQESQVHWNQLDPTLLKQLQVSLEEFKAFPQTAGFKEIQAFWTLSAPGKLLWLSFGEGSLVYLVLLFLGGVSWLSVDIMFIKVQRLLWVCRYVVEKSAVPGLNVLEPMVRHLNSLGLLSTERSWENLDKPKKKVVAHKIPVGEGDGNSKPWYSFILKPKLGPEQFPFAGILFRLSAGKTDGQQDLSYQNWGLDTKRLPIYMSVVPLLIFSAVWWFSVGSQNLSTAFTAQELQSLGVAAWAKMGGWLGLLSITAMSWLSLWGILILVHRLKSGWILVLQLVVLFMSSVLLQQPFVVLCLLLMIVLWDGLYDWRGLLEKKPLNV
jgi:hypothetical protein